MAFAIVTDSSSNLTEEVIDQFDLHILPLTFMVDGEEHHSYLKGQKTDLKQFYTMMREGKVITTSLPNLKDSRELLEGLLASGQDVLYIGFSSGLSGTYQAIDLLLAELADAYPDRTVLAVDTLAASMGEGLLVWYAAKMREEGASITEVRDWLEANKLHLCHWFTVDDLFFLKRGGRVSAATALVGSALGIKPVLHVDNEGHLINVSKARGRKNSILALVDRMERSAIEPEKQTVFISHGDCEGDANRVAEDVKRRFGVQTVVLNNVGPVIGAHSGPGTVALFFLGRHR